MSDAAARARYLAAHWGLAGDRAVADLPVADPFGGTLTVLGQLRSVEYEADKRGDGPSLYVHKFRRAYPLLCFTHFGPHSLVIVGGDYRMQVRGIVR